MSGSSGRPADTSTRFGPFGRASRIAVAVLVALSSAFCLGLDHLWGRDMAGFFSWATYLLAAIGVSAYVVSLAEWPSGPVRHLVAGAVLAAGVGAGMIGTILLPLTLMGLILLVGFLGFVPLLVAYALVKRFSALMRDHRGPCRSSEYAPVGVGFVIAWTLPVLVNRVEDRWLERRYAEAAKSEDAIAADGIDRLAAYPMCRRGCFAALCGPEVLDRPGPAVRAALARALDGEPQSACERILD